MQVEWQYVCAWVCAFACAHVRACMYVWAPSRFKTSELFPLDSGNTLPTSIKFEASYIWSRDRNTLMNYSGGKTTVFWENRWYELYRPVRKIPTRSWSAKPLSTWCHLFQHRKLDLDLFCFPQMYTCATIKKLTKVCKPTKCFVSGWVTDVQSRTNARTVLFLPEYVSFFHLKLLNIGASLHILRVRIGERCAVTYKCQNSVVSAQLCDLIFFNFFFFTWNFEV